MRMRFNRLLVEVLWSVVSIRACHALVNDQLAGSHCWSQLYVCNEYSLQVRYGDHVMSLSEQESVVCIPLVITYLAFDTSSQNCCFQACRLCMEISERPH